MMASNSEIYGFHLLMNREKQSKKVSSIRLLHLEDLNLQNMTTKISIVKSLPKKDSALKIKVIKQP